jgi:prephenate dehydrogenase
VEKICIIGMGLIGGSLGMSLKKNLPKAKIHAVVRNAKHIPLILSKKAADEVSLDAKPAIKDASFVILATPPLSFEEILSQISPFLSPDQIVTDAGSIKTFVMKLFQKYIGKKANYIGAHPIAGSEFNGISAAREDLFDGAKCILTPDKNTKSETLERTGRLWKTAGAIPMAIKAAEHDKIFAYVSHTPHLVSFSLVHAIGRHKEFAKLGGPAWKDMTRVAHSSSGLWAEISHLNKKYVDASLKQVIQSLQHFRKQLGKISAIEKSLKKAQQSLK